MLLTIDKHFGINQEKNLAINLKVSKKKAGLCILAIGNSSAC